MGSDAIKIPHCSAELRGMDQVQMLGSMPVLPMPGSRTGRAASVDNRSHAVTSEPFSDLARGFALRLPKSDISSSRVV